MLVLNVKLFCFLFSSVFIGISQAIVPHKNLLCELNFITWYGILWKKSLKIEFEICVVNISWGIPVNDFLQMKLIWSDIADLINIWNFWPISQSIYLYRENLPVDGIHSSNFLRRIRFNHKNDTPRNGRSMWCWFLLISMLWIFGQQFFYKCLCLWTNSMHVIRQWDLHCV